MLFKSKDESTLIIHKKQRFVDSLYQKQKAKTKETKSKDIRSKMQRLVIDAEMQTKIFYFSLGCTKIFAVVTIK